MTYCSFCMEGIEPNYKICPHCGKAVRAEIPVHHLLPGTILHEKFLVGAALGEGGFGITYIGRDLTLDIKVAIKEFFPNGYVNRSNTVSSDITCSVSDERKDVFEKGKVRFLNEARILAKFAAEPGVVEVRDFFEENNTAYIIMEYLDGDDLKSLVKANGRMSPQAAISTLMPVMRTLTKIHAQDLIHRDISPDNIRMCRGSAKLLDFGAARDVSDAANKSLSVMLKPGFAPEEQYRSRGNQGPWTDVYALCATLYVCITGVTPDDATQRVYSDEVKRPSELGIAIDRNTEEALMKGMAVHQKDRFQSVEALINALTGAAPTAAHHQPAHASAPQQPAYAPPQQAVSTAPVKKKSKAPLVILITVLVVALAAAVGVVFYLLNENGSSSGKRSKSSDDSTTEGSAADTSGHSVGDTAAVVEPTEDTTGETVMSDELFDYTVEICGVVYKLPCSYDDFIDNGWAISRYSSNDEDTVVLAEDYEYVDMKKGDMEITVYAYNYSGNSKLLKNCKIGAVKWDADEVTAGIAQGITAYSTPEEIIACFGTPTDYNIYENYSYLNYEQNDSYDNKVEFYCYTGDRIGSSHITVRNFIKTTDDHTTTNERRPSYLSEYVPPTAKSDSITSAVISIDGKLYQLPAPLTVFTANGWTVKSKPGFVISGGSGSVELTKGNMELSVTVRNFAEYQTTPENCAVTEAWVYDSDNVNIEIGGGITIGSTVAAVQLKSSGIEDFSFYDGYCSYYEYEYSDGREFDIYMSFDSENKIKTINIACESWDY